MSREEFMRRLRERMRGFSETETARVLEYYYEFWTEARDAGRTDDEITASLDSPESIAADVRANLAFTAMDENPGFMSFGKVVTGVLLGILAIPFAIPLIAVLFSLVVTVIAVLFSIGVVVFALLVTGAALMGSGIYCFAGGAWLIGTGLLGSGTFVTGFMLLCSVGFIAAMKAVFGALGNLFRWVYRKVTKKGGYAASEGGLHQ